MIPRLIRTWRYRINRRNRNLLIIVCGATGTGKSYSALTVAKLIDPSFKPSERVVFRIEEFMNILQSGRLKRGNVIIWDEAGVGIPSREWYSISNKAINYVLQTFRHLNLCVIFTTPSFNYIDSQTRVLFHVYMECLKINFEKKTVITKVMENQFNPAMGKEYRKYFWCDGEKKERINIGKPSKDMIDEYEVLKTEFSQRLRDEVQKDVCEVNEKLFAKRITDEEIQVKLKEWKVRPTLPEVQRIFRIGRDRANYNILTIWGPATRGRPKGGSRQTINATPVANEIVPL